MLDLDGDGVELVSLSSSTAFYDGDKDGFREKMGWAGADEFMFAQRTAADDTDLEAFASLHDSNRDGVFDSSDDDWSKAGVWHDADQDGAADAGEFHTLPSLGITSIDLTSDGVSEDVGGNRIHGRSTYTLTGGTTRQLADVELQASAFGHRRTATGVEIRVGDDVLAFLGEGTEAFDIDAAENGYVLVRGGSGDDTLRTTGTAGVVLLGDAGADTLESGSGNDWLHGGAGADTLRGGAGHDVLFIDASDTVDGGAGFDVAVAATDKAITLDLAATNMEAAFGGAGDDRLDGSKATRGVPLHGGDGSDTLLGSPLSSQNR